METHVGDTITRYHEHNEVIYVNISYIELRMRNQVSYDPPNISGFIAQLVRGWHWYGEVMASNPVEVLKFSGFYKRNCMNCVNNCQDCRLLDFTSAVQYMKYFIYNFNIHSSQAHQNPQMTSS